MQAKPAIVHIVSAVTTITGPGQADFFHRLRVAGNTLDRFVLAGQGEPGLPVVIECPLLPRTRIVAGFTLVTEPAPMIVIPPVTGDTRYRCALVGLVLVALYALNIFMLAIQRKRRQAMIEQGALPIAFVVAIVALPALFPLVDVIAPVTGITGFTQPLLAQYTLVAGCTPDSIVPATQREAGFLVMIEYGPGPGLLRMAGFTFPAKLALVTLFKIVLAMTGITLLRCVLVILVPVTGITLNVPVLSQ